MKKTLIGAAAVALGITGALAFVGTAQAAPAPTADCKSFTVNLTDRPDTGTDGSVWAKDAMARTAKVCVEASTPTLTAVATTWNYSALVTDVGTFKTVAGKTPVAKAPLVAGIEGKVNGGFVADFSAPANWQGWNPAAVNNTTTTGNWLSTAFPGANGTLVGEYHWTYASDCETYTDNNGKYTGDITSKCVTAKAPAWNEPACGKAAEIVGITNVVGVQYKVNTPKDGKVVVTAKAKPGYVLTGDDRWVLKVPVVKVCPTTPAATPTPTPSDTTGAPTPSNTESTPVGAALPVTGDGGGVNKPLAFTAGGVAMIAAGGIILLVLRRRRDAVNFTA